MVAFDKYKYFWKCMHFTALGFPDTPSVEEREDYKKFLLGFGKILPCSKCRNNFERHVATLPIELYLFGPQQLFDWTVRLHNVVNKELGKPEWTYEMAYDYYTKADGVNEYSVNKVSNTPMAITFLNISLLVILLFAIFIAYKKR